MLHKGEKLLPSEQRKNVSWGKLTFLAVLLTAMDLMGEGFLRGWNAYVLNTAGSAVFGLCFVEKPCHSSPDIDAFLGRPVMDCGTA